MLFIKSNKLLLRCVLLFVACLSHVQSLLVVWYALLVVLGLLMLRAGVGVVVCGSGPRLFLLLLDSYCLVLRVVFAAVCCAVFALDV